MSSPAADQDHSIEEILASIRQIISEDDQKSGGDSMSAVTQDVVENTAPVDLPLPPVAAMDAPVDFTDPMPSATGDTLPDDDVFELVDRVDDTPMPESPLPIVDDSAFDLPPVPSAPEPEPLSDPLPRVDDRMAVQSVPLSASGEMSVFTNQATSATLGAFSKLSETVLMERKRVIDGASVTLEDIVKDLLQPLLREWIDRNVPGLVDRLVREELEKIARQVRDL